MQYTIKSSSCTVKLGLDGAMLNSIKMGGTEYLWQSDERYWKGQAPVCFPIVGVLKDGTANAFGKKTSMKRHGVARINEFSVSEQLPNSITFVQKSNQNTKKEFPFDYELKIKYTVVNNTVTTEYTVTNTGKEKLPFTIGGHPAFNCPLTDDEKFEDYSVKFDKKINHPCLRPDIHSGLIDISKRYDVVTDSDEIKMDHNLFVDDAMVFDGIETKETTLVGKNNKGVKLEYQDFANLLIWSSANGGNFVALEPWTGISTCSDENEIFENKRGMTILEKGETTSLKFKITLF